MKVREPVDRPLDIIAAELLLSISQAFVVGVLLYLAVGAWAERGVAAGTIAAILVALAFAVGGAWLYWLLGGIGLPLAAADLPVALFLGFSALLGLRGDPLVTLDPLALVLTVAGAVYGIVAGVFLDSPRRLRWDQRRTPRRREPVPRVTSTTAALVARARGVRPSASSGTSAPAGSRSSAAPAPVEREPSPPPVVTEAPPAPIARPPSKAPTVAAPDVPAKQVTPTRAPARTGTTTGASRSTTSPSTTAPDALELPTSVEPRAQKSPWAWARPPEWNREEERFEDEAEDERA